MSGQATPLRDPRAPRFPVIVEHPTFGDIKQNFSGGDYARWGGVTAASFPLGYVFGASRCLRALVWRWRCLDD